MSVPADKSIAADKFERLIRSLADVGLSTEVRNGNNLSILVFIKPASERHLAAAAYRSR